MIRPLACILYGRIVARPGSSRRSVTGKAALQPANWKLPVPGSSSAFTIRVKEDTSPWPSARPRCPQPDVAGQQESLALLTNVAFRFSATPRPESGPSSVSCLEYGDISVFVFQ